MEELIPLLKALLHLAEVLEHAATPVSHAQGGGACAGYPEECSFGSAAVQLKDATHAVLRAIEESVANAEHDLLEEALEVMG